jgi:ABC-type Mn2+/Zn2+ transport system permease subunit
MRRVLALAAAAAAAAAGGLILGEYELTGFTPVVAGVLFGLVVGEVAIVAGKQRDTVTAAVCGAFAAAGMVWAAWISSGKDWDYVPGGVWAGVALAAVAALWWIRNPGRRAAGSRRAP